MKKVQFFLLIEVILLTFGLMSILSHSLSNFVLIVIIIGLTLKFYNQVNKNNFYLTATLLTLFLMLMLNPFIILSILFFIMYIVLNYFSHAKRKNQFSLISLTDKLQVTAKKNQWFGNSSNQLDNFAFDDINIIRFIGNDTIDLSNCIILNKENIIVIQKVYGSVNLVVPIDVTVSVTVSSIYGKLDFFDYDPVQLRNETIKLSESFIFKDVKQVRLIVNCLLGDIKVVRK